MGRGTHPYSPVWVGKNRNKSASWSCLANTTIYNWLVVSTPLKNISQLGLLFPVYGKKKLFQTTNQIKSITSSCMQSGPIWNLRSDRLQDLGLPSNPSFLGWQHSTGLIPSFSEANAWHGAPSSKLQIANKEPSLRWAMGLTKWLATSICQWNNPFTNYS